MCSISPSNVQFTKISYQISVCVVTKYGYSYPLWNFMLFSVLFYYFPPYLHIPCQDFIINTFEHSIEQVAITHFTQ